MKQFVIKWNNDWPKDWWWRNKHNIPFNSQLHRRASQIDIVFEAIEDDALKSAMKDFEKDEKRKKRLLKDGWSSESKTSKKRSKEGFDKLDLSKIK